MTRALLSASLSGFALLLVTALPVRASSLAELSATTGVHNSLAGTGATSASRTLDSVRRSLSKSSGNISGHGGSSWLTNDSSSGGGRGGRSSRSGSRGGNGWATADNGGKGGWVKGGDDHGTSTARRRR